MYFKFTKWQGAGNDFALVNGFTETIGDYKAAAVAACDRHYGVGADGLVLILPSERADFKMRIFNPDGGEAEMCGNVTRCFARYVYEQKLTDKTKLTVETLAGIVRPELILEGGRVAKVKVDMGEPRLEADQIPARGGGRIIAAPFTAADGRSYNITCVSMGNPHCVIFVDDADTVDLTAWGPVIENDPLFPRKTNVEFAEVKDRRHIRMRVWERGAGVTLACGTGACSALVAAALNGLTERDARLELDGGDLWIEWSAADNHVYMTGPAEEVFRGEYRNDAL